MQDTESKENAPYCASVPKAVCFDVFDPKRTKPVEQSWKDFIMKDVSELGTFVLEGHFRRMAEIGASNAKGFKWVIATLDDVVESDEAIELHGKAVVFDPKRI